MKNVLKITMAVALAAGTVAATMPEAFAHTDHRNHQQAVCVNKDVVPLLIVGAALGAVTGGVGSAVVWGAAYAVGGAAVGGAGGLLLAGGAHPNQNCG